MDRGIAAGLSGRGAETDADSTRRRDHRAGELRRAAGGGVILPIALRWGGGSAQH